MGEEQYTRSFACSPPCSATESEAMLAQRLPTQCCSSNGFSGKVQGSHVAWMVCSHLWSCRQVHGGAPCGRVCDHMLVCIARRLPCGQRHKPRYACHVKPVIVLQAESCRCQTSVLTRRVPHKQKRLNRMPACLQQQHRLQVFADVLPDVACQPGRILQQHHTSPISAMSSAAITKEPKLAKAVVMLGGG
jgi:hypothetical protein